MMLLTYTPTRRASFARSHTHAIARVSLGIMLVAILGGLLGGCTGAPAPGKVDIRDLEFVPRTIVVPAGTTVTWTTFDETAHIIQTDDFQVNGKSQLGQFTSQPIGPGESFSHRFDTPGTFTYSDPLQAYITGTVVVK